MRAVITSCSRGDRCGRIATTRNAGVICQRSSCGSRDIHVEGHGHAAGCCYRRGGRQIESQRLAIDDNITDGTAAADDGAGNQAHACR